MVGRRQIWQLAKASFNMINLTIFILIYCIIMKDSCSSTEQVTVTQALAKPSTTIIIIPLSSCDICVGPNFCVYIWDEILWWTISISQSFANSELLFELRVFWTCNTNAKLTIKKVIITVTYTSPLNKLG